MALAVIDQYSTAALFAGTFFLTYLVWNRLTKQRLDPQIRLPPSVGGLPFIGSLPFLPDRCKMPQFFLDKALSGAEVMTFYAGGKSIVVLSSYEVIREVLLRQSVESADRPHHFLNEYVLNPNSNGIVDAHYNNTFKKFHQLSLAILKDFGFGQRMMEERIRIEVEDLMSNFRELKGEAVYPKPLMAASVLSVISSIVMGDRLKDPEINRCVGEAAEDMTHTSIELFPVEFLHSLVYLPKFKTTLGKVVAAQTSLLELSDKKIKDCLSARKEGPVESFISHFVDREGNEFDREQLKYITRDLLLAGFETSSTTLLWALLSLANRVDIQEKLQSEIDSVVPRDRLPSLDDKNKLIYVEAFILEVMRHDTLVPLSVPRAALEDINVGECTIPKGTMIMTNLYAVHMNKVTWGDPESFRPERFIDTSCNKIINKERVIPFSLGKRSCLGELLARQELYLFITGLLQQFQIRPPQGVDHIDVKEIKGFTVSPEPFHVRFLARD